MTTLRKAAQQALDTLLKSHTCPLMPDDCEAAIAALRAALAEPVQEPVAWQCSVCGGGTLLCLHNQTDVPLYTAPPQRRPLPDEEIDELSRTMVKGNKSVNWLCRAIERAHGIET